MEKNIIEEWKPIEGFEGLYQISNLGRVKSLKDNNGNPREKIMKPQLIKGYCHIRLTKNGETKNFRIHRLVALAFIPNPDNLPQVNHIDENKTNNCADNLEWCDCKYNINFGTANERRGQNNDYKKIGEINSLKLKNHKLLSKPVLQFDLEGKAVAEYPSIHEAERQTGFHSANISRCCRGKYKTCGGFIWKYKE